MSRMVMAQARAVVVAMSQMVKMDKAFCDFVRICLSAY